MTTRQQWTVVLLIVALLIGGLFAVARSLGDELFPVQVGSRAPDFVAMTLDAVPAPRTLASYEGKTVLLNIWATWCTPCRVEMPSMQALHREYGPSGLRVVAVSVDESGTTAKIREFVRELGLTFEVLHDATGEIQQTYQLTGLPETFLIRADGVIIKRVIGATDWHSVANRALVARLLEVPAPSERRDNGAPESTTPSQGDILRKPTSRPEWMIGERREAQPDERRLRPPETARVGH